MRAVKGVLLLLAAIAVVTGLLYVQGHTAFVDRLTDLVVALQLGLPVAIDLERLLVLLSAVSLGAVLLVFCGCMVLVARPTLALQKQANHIAAIKREIAYIKDQQLRDDEQLRSIGVTLTRRLDKRALLQTILEVASRMTSVPQANSVVGFWALKFETDTLRFEKGLYCDETMFPQLEVQPADATFSRVISTQQVWTAPSWEESPNLIKREKAAQLGSATGVMMVPLMVENSVLGVLVIFCHPDVLKSYEGQQPFYAVIWGELSMALAIAVQGEMAILDRLTGVHNREYFMKRLTQEIERANRYQLPLSLLMLDIDNFKLVNDMLGHPQGDAVLKIIAKLIKKSVRPIDLVGRYGGEEFVIMLPETGYGEDPSASGAPVVAERIRKAIDEEFRGLQKPLNLTISVGVALRRFPEDRATEYQELVRLADEQLYRAKAAGKNRVCVFIPEKVQGVT